MRIKTGTVVEEKDIVETLMADGAFNILVKSIRAAGLVGLLRDTDRTFTLFAPNEKAFKALVPGGRLRSILDDQPLLAGIIRRHIVPARVMAGHIDGREVLRTLNGDHLLITVTGHLRVNDIDIVRTDVRCRNGVIHEIDGVLLPG